MTSFVPFAMERMMSKWENVVDYNLSESGVHPITLGELIAIDEEQMGSLLATELNYPQANGSVELRDTIASLYNGANRDNVLVTVGAAEGNYLTMRTLLEQGDEMAIMLPNYMQVWGIAKNHGVHMNTFHLREENDWALDVDELNAAVTDKTRLIAVCNPNNPTGYIMTAAEMDAVVNAADRVGAWILSDEVYGGAERVAEEQTPSFYGLYDKVVAMGSMSKAYGMPGLRIGWSVGPADTLDDMWARHEYTTISTTMLSNKLANLALSPEVRPRIIERTRKYIRKGYPVLDRWMKSHGDIFSYTPPGAAAITFVRYNLDVNSTVLHERLYKEKSVLIVPGDHFGMDKFLRISFGLPHDFLTAALGRIHEMIVELGG